MSDKIAYLKNEYREQAQAVHKNSQRGGNEPPEGGGLEARVAKLESHVEYIRRDIDALRIDLGEFRTETKTATGKIRDNLERDFRLLFSCLIIVSLGLAGLMAKGFHWL